MFPNTNNGPQLEVHMTINVRAGSCSTPVTNPSVQTTHADTCKSGVDVVHCQMSGLPSPSSFLVSTATNTFQDHHSWHMPCFCVGWSKRTTRKRKQQTLRKMFPLCQSQGPLWFKTLFQSMSIYAGIPCCTSFEDSILGISCCVGAGLHVNVRHTRLDRCGLPIQWQ
jgi:hypothetical protein